ncbi:hypothetical protein U8V72_20910 [Priestia filamentosa]|uniref:hypothetical protein n=1 Tax=Priestia filamentosa TaxID=1402861 RepID=UPI00397C883A
MVNQKYYQNKKYIPPLYGALMRKDYGTANEIIDEHEKENRKLATKEYFGLRDKCKDLDSFLKCINHLHLFRSPEGGVVTLYYLMKDMSNVEGVSRRINFLYKTALSEGQFSKEMKSDVAAYAYQHDRKDVAFKLLKTGAVPITLLLGKENITMLELAIKQKDTQFLDILFTEQRKAFFQGFEKDGDKVSAIEKMAEFKLMKELLEDKYVEMTTEERDIYNSYQFMNLVGKSK